MVPIAAKVGARVGPQSFGRSSSPAARLIKFKKHSVNRIDTKERANNFSQGGDDCSHTAGNRPMVAAMSYLHSTYGNGALPGPWLLRKGLWLVRTPNAANGVAASEIHQSGRG
jgi:hypothetical protein